MFLNKVVMLLIISGATACVVGCCESYDKCMNDATVTDNHNVGPIDTIHKERLDSAQNQVLLTQRVLRFDYDGYDLNPEAKEIVVAHAKNLLQTPTLRIGITGHTDERGSQKYNIALGMRRAKAVAKVLELNGVPKDRITVLSYGKAQPVVTGSNERAWSQNRRVELVYEGTS